MQATSIMAVVPKSPSNPAQGAGDGSAPALDTDFFALLKAQIKSGPGIDAVSLPPAEDIAPPLADVVAQRDIKLLSGEDSALLNENLASLVVGGMPVPAVVMQHTEPTTAPADRMLQGVKSDSDFLGQFGKEPPKVNSASLDSRQVAEFAVDGKELPQNQAGKKGDGVTLPVLSAETHRLPEVSPNPLPVIMAASHSSVIEAKALPLSPATLQAPVGSAAWGDALGQKVVWMAGQKTQIAELHLNPPNLGPMEVRLSVSNDQVSALFVSHQPAVREAIEAAMPRLREMLADSGMALGNATVSSDSLPQQTSGREGQSGSSRQGDFLASANMHLLPNMGGVIPLRQDGSGMVDLFA